MSNAPVALHRLHRLLLGLLLQFRDAFETQPASQLICSSTQQSAFALSLFNTQESLWPPVHPCCLHNLVKAFAGLSSLNSIGQCWLVPTAVLVVTKWWWMGKGGVGVGGLGWRGRAHCAADSQLRCLIQTSFALFSCASTSASYSSHNGPRLLREGFQEEAPSKFWHC